MLIVSLNETNQTALIAVNEQLLKGAPKLYELLMRKHNMLEINLTDNYLKVSKGNDTAFIFPSGARNPSDIAINLTVELAQHLSTDSHLIEGSSSNLVYWISDTLKLDSLPAGEYILVDLTATSVLDELVKEVKVKPRRVELTHLGFDQVVEHTEIKSNYDSLTTFMYVVIAVLLVVVFQIYT